CACRRRWTFRPAAERSSPAPQFPPVMVATESWPPNLAAATRRLHPRGVVVVADLDEPPLPFAEAAFNLVTSRHPATVWWAEIARVLQPGGAYLAQHIGPGTMWELVEHFLGPQPQAKLKRHPNQEITDARSAGLQIVGVRSERLRVEFFDVAAVIFFLRKVIWTVPGFTAEVYRERLYELHEQIQRDGPFVAHSTRTLIEAHKPTTNHERHDTRA
ncbi:MAG TPA: methyltransferase domain-containing protein, partial [Jiangellaceae bacterium]|nr:methyltransferase domain-containing protein [Jiangellaceae bacterium]